MSETIAAVRAANHTTVEKSWVISSIRNNAPASGALNAADSPAATPLAINVFRSCLVLGNRSSATP